MRRSEVVSVLLNPNIPIFPFMELPKDFLVDTGRLAGCFKHTSATYKFYWMLGLLAEVEQGRDELWKKALFAHMVAGAWYTVNYFKVSFGARVISCSKR